MRPYSNPGFITLYYRSAGFKECGAPINGFTFKPNEYYPVTYYPRIEMTCDTAWDIGDDLVTITASPAWRLQARRPVEPGDLFTRAPVIYMFVDPDNSFELLNATTVNPPLVWSHLRIVRLAPNWNQLKEQCKVLI